MDHGETMLLRFSVSGLGWPAFVQQRFPATSFKQPTKLTRPCARQSAQPLNHINYAAVAAIEPVSTRTPTPMVEETAIFFK